MDYLMGVLAKRFSDLRFDEFVTFMTIVFLCLLLVVYAITTLIKQIRKVEHKTPQPANKSLKTVGALRDYQGFTD